MSMRLRLTLWSTMLVGLVLVLFAGLVYVVVSRQLTSQFDYALHLQALDTSRSMHALPLTPSTSQTMQRQPLMPTGTSQGFYVQVVDARGSVLARSANLSQPMPTSRSSVQSALGGEESHATLNVSSERVSLYSAPLLLDDQFLGVLQVAAPLQSLERNLARLKVGLGSVVVTASVAAAVIGWFLASKAMRPVDRMTQTARAIADAGDLSRRVPHFQQPDELGRLAATFNDMLAQLEQAFVAQQRFLADASHELRTPLATLRMNVESLLRMPQIHPADQRATVQSMARETERMGRLVADLLALARADAGQPLSHESVALDMVLLDVYQQLRSLAPQVQLQLGDFEQIAIEGDPERLKQLILNLVDNAVRYTPQGGTVRLDLIERDGWAVIRVQDTGVGIPAAALARIFERFYRADQPRTRMVGGTGLGLAICKWVVVAHGGRIDVVSTEGSGSTFTVMLPLRAHATDGTLAEPQLLRSLPQA